VLRVHGRRPGLENGLLLRGRLLRARLVLFLARFGVEDELERRYLPRAFFQMRVDVERAELRRPEIRAELRFLVAVNE
jgi:hypothetical protein